MFWIFPCVCLLLGIDPVLPATVLTNHGPIEGKSVNIFNGQNVNAFLGVPYAAPPIGPYRFAPPQPLNRWNKTLKTTKLPVSCYQSVTDHMKKTVWFMSETEESEDCLYLNIWSPNLKPDKLMEVMIWIHGGAYFSGSSNLPDYDGSILASVGNVVVVSMNYRLSAFGFLYMNSTKGPGNAGLQDQMQAIRWVSDNARFFGGDKTKITLFGQSVGGLSVNFHLTNPEFSQIFRYGIAQSGAAKMQMFSQSMSAALANSAALARSVNCPTGRKEEMIKCLRSKSPAELIVHNYPLNPGVQITAVKNGVEVPEDIFTINKETPAKLKKKNLMAGNVLNELNFAVFMYFSGKELTYNLTITEEELRTMLKSVYNIEDKRLQDVVIFQYKNFSKTYDPSQVRAEAIDMITDRDISCPVIDFSKDWISDTNQVFYYYFSVRPSAADKIRYPDWAGPTHGSEIYFVFGFPLDPAEGYTEAEKQLSKKMMAFWLNFAKTGNPNGYNVGGNVWPPVTGDVGLDYLYVGNNSVTAKKFLKERECDFWDNIYPELLSIQKNLENK